MGFRVRIDYLTPGGIIILYYTTLYDLFSLSYCLGILIEVIL